MLPVRMQATATPSRFCLFLVNGLRSAFNTSRKAKFLETLATKSLGCDFVTYDHAGHGDSPQKDFKECTLETWKTDLIKLLQTPSIVAPHQKVVLVGSSMGCHLALIAANILPNKVAGIIGIGGALNFRPLVQEFYANVESPNQELWIRPSQYDQNGYPISRKLIESMQDSTNVFDESKRIPISCPVELVHGMQDHDVSYENAIKISSLLSGADINIVLVKNGDHRLSSDAHLHIIGDSVKRVFSKLKDLDNP